ncbi:MAG: hypothetical protein PVI37_00150 [Gammaproteobacteria bacterium]
MLDAADDDREADLTAHRQQEELFTGLGLWILLALIVAVYWQGLSGPFLVDDLVNLPLLGSMGSVHDWQTLRYYLLSGVAGPTHRPIALLSFLLDANTWPAAPEPFKYTNLMIHALNACLLFWLFRKLLTSDRNASMAGHAGWLAVLGAAAWGLHPLLVSTTLYVVQRMTELSALFILAGLIGYVHGRGLLHSAPRRGYAWMTASLGLGALFATFSKENGALLPTLAWTLEATVLARANETARPSRAWRALMFWLPTAVIAAYLLWLPFANGWFTLYPHRDFTPAERLMTEGRALMLGLYHWFVPRMMTKGVFYDGYAVSTGLLSPATTMPAMFAVAALLFYGFRSRKTHPYFALAIIFYFAAQMLEASSLGLELYWEHRNYLPSIFLFMPLLGLAARFHNRRLMPIAAAAIVALLASMTFARAALWGRELPFLATMSRTAPMSERAQRSFAAALDEKGRPGDALAVLEAAIERMPDSMQLRLHEAVIQCFHKPVTSVERQAILQAARHVQYDSRSFNLIDSFVSIARKPDCRGLDDKLNRELLTVLLSRTQTGKAGSWARQQLHISLGAWYARHGQMTRALEEFRKSLGKQNTIDSKLIEAAILASNNQPERARRTLDDADKMVHEGVRGPTHRTPAQYLREIQHMRKQLGLRDDPATDPPPVSH